jgi:hypothetical protein
MVRDLRAYSRTEQRMYALGIFDAAAELAKLLDFTGGTIGIEDIYNWCQEVSDLQRRG